MFKTLITAAFAIVAALACIGVSTSYEAVKQVKQAVHSRPARA